MSSNESEIELFRPFAASLGPSVLRFRPERGAQAGLRLTVTTQSKRGRGHLTAHVSPPTRREAGSRLHRDILGSSVPGAKYRTVMGPPWWLWCHHDLEPQFPPK